MITNSYGRILNISSMVVKQEIEGEAIYPASKASSISLTRVRAKEIYSYGITCNATAPSALATDLIGAVNRESVTNLLLPT
jgi:NAD(P)-dependent dehydrogenase (short-subunit alcohol dehydrogenase family)